MNIYLYRATMPCGDDYIVPTFDTAWMIAGIDGEVTILDMEAKQENKR